MYPSRRNNERHLVKETEKERKKEKGGGGRERKKRTERKKGVGYRHEMIKAYLSTNSIRFSNSSIEPPTSKKSSTTVVRTEFWLAFAVLLTGVLPFSNETVWRFPATGAGQEDIRSWTNALALDDQVVGVDGGRFLEASLRAFSSATALSIRSA